MTHERTPLPAPTELEVLGQAIKRAQYRNHRTMDTSLQAIGTTLVQWDALRAIDRMPGASAHDLAAATFQSDQSFGALATRLVGRGLVERSPGVGRRIEHRLTDAGAAMLDAGHDVALEVLDTLFAPLDAAARRALLPLLQRLTADGSTAGRQRSGSR